MKRLLSTLPLALLFVACSSGGANAPAEPAPPPALDPTGVYDCLLDVDGTAWDLAVADGLHPLRPEGLLCLRARVTATNSQ